MYSYQLIWPLLLAHRCIPLSPTNKTCVYSLQVLLQHSISVVEDNISHSPAVCYYSKLIVISVTSSRGNNMSRVPCPVTSHFLVSDHAICICIFGEFFKTTYIKVQQYRGILLSDCKFLQLGNLHWSGALLECIPINTNLIHCIAIVPSYSSWGPLVVSF